MSARLALSGIHLAGRLDGVELTLPAGQVTGICGANGAGKSSLLAVAAGDLRPAAGRVLLDGVPLADLPPRVLARRRAMLPQEHGLGLDYRVADLLALGAGMLPAGERAGVVAELAAHLDLAGLLERPWSRLSGGERQRAQLGRVLAQVWGQAGQAVLLLDEPGNHLDPRHRLALDGLLRAVADRGGCVVVVAHDLAALAGLADRLVLLHQGRVLAGGEPEAVLTAAHLRTAFGVDGHLDWLDGQPVLRWAVPGAATLGTPNPGGSGHD